MDDAPQIAQTKTNDTSRAWWSGSLAEFLSNEPTSIIERLALRAIETHPTNRDTQLRAWQAELPILRNACAVLPQNWRLLLEYPLIRLGRRLDTVLVSDRAIIVLEFKTLSSSFTSAARDQAEDYAFDLRDFHSGSRLQVIIPIVIATNGQPARPQWSFPWRDVTAVYEALPSQLGALINELLDKIPHRDLDIDGWEHAAYRPVPTIIEAARALYAKHGVADIRSARADTKNLNHTTNVILESIEHAKTNHQHIILFVTGIPGAGKTLCGLDAVFSSSTDGTFLTGTLPMVYVLKAALAQDAAKAGVKSSRTATHETKSKIESITGFLRYYLKEPSHLPEHVIVFDEAQRAWDADYGATKFKHTDSEAGIVLDIMQRHRDYAVIVALVGNGQEINTGEAGLAEWGNALAKRPIWTIIGAPGVLTATDNRQRLFVAQPPSMRLEPALHLDIPIRNFRSASAAPWVDAILRGNIQEAQQHAAADLPFYLTRSLPEMRRSLRIMARGGRRAGLVCSSGAKRLVADGLWPKFEHMDDALVANWFLKRWPDVRASDALEIPATEFACQGLELDYVGLCWGGDLIWAGGWLVRNFVGNKWRHARQQAARDYQINTYRVLLTRARANTVIWVPPGDPEDETRDPQSLDQTAAYLVECGAKQLPNFALEAPIAAAATLF